MAARGVEALVYNKGYMRLIVGCTLEENEIEAIKKGYKKANKQFSILVLKDVLSVFNRKSASLNTLSDLELLVWLVKNGFLELKSLFLVIEQRENLLLVIRFFMKNPTLLKILTKIVWRLQVV